MESISGTFLGAPHSRLGWWSVGLTILFVMLFVCITNDLIHFSGLLTMTLGVAAGIITVIALAWKRERSWLVWLMLLPGLFAIAFSLGEILVPH